MVCARRLLLCYACRGTACHVCLTVGHHGCACPLGPPTGGRRGATAMSLLVVVDVVVVGAECTTTIDRCRGRPSYPTAGSYYDAIAGRYIR